MKKRRYTKHYAIYSPLIKEVIGVCTDDGKDDVMSEEPNCELRRINKKEFDRFGEDICPFCHEPSIDCPCDEK